MKEDELKDLHIVSISLAFVCLMCPGPLSLNVPSRSQPFVSDGLYIGSGS